MYHHVLHNCIKMAYVFIFTHGLCYKGINNAADKFALLEKKLRNTILQEGGSISHHHGVGKIRAEFSDQMYTPFTKKTLLQLKKQLDPKNIMGIQNNIFYKKPVTSTKK